MMSLRKVTSEVLARGGVAGAVVKEALGRGAIPQAWASTSASSKPKKASSKAPQRTVFISQSSDVFANLALEDWLYKNWSFERRNVLLLWRNSPCVVIGRHQNPQVEANLPYLESAGVPVARRGSGGGAVYHDHGNLNCTFFTTRERYNRHSNLEVICRALNHDFGIQAHPNPRDDIIVDHDHKVSGSAAKLGRTTAYHHCTLLVNTDRQQLRLSLNGDKSIKSKATASVPAHVMNLSELQPNINVEQVLTSVGKAFLGQDHHLANGFTLVNPSDEWFPGLAELEAVLRSSRWLEGQTPRCTITRRLPIPQGLLPHASNTSLAVTVQAYHGLVEEVRMEEDVVKEEEGVAELLQDIGAGLKGAPYTPDTFNIIAGRLRFTPALADMHFPASARPPPTPTRSVI